MKRRVNLLMLLIICCLGGPVVAEPIAFSVTGSLGVLSDERPEAAKVLATLGWAPQEFEVVVRPVAGRDYQALVEFASPKPSGDAGIDTVVMRWYRPPGNTAGQGAAVASDGSGLGATGELPSSVLLVHTLHPDLPVATMLARGLRQRGVHAFVIELPGYASRVATPRKMTGVTALVNGAQTVADCRRAYDVIKTLATEPRVRALLAPADAVDAKEAALALYNPERIAIQGTSLGSFFATAASALDGCFSQTFLFLSGGDGVSILKNGQKDAYHVRGALKHYGYDGEKLEALIDTVEPLHIAHRLDPDTTWMFNARDDLVIPAENATLLAEAIELDASHHIWMAGNHYTAFVLLPGVLDKIGKELERHAAEAVNVEAEQEAVTSPVR